MIKVSSLNPTVVLNTTSKEQREYIKELELSDNALVASSSDHPIIIDNNVTTPPLNGKTTVIGLNTDGIIDSLNNKKNTYNVAIVTGLIVVASYYIYSRFLKK